MKENQGIGTNSRQNMHPTSRRRQPATAMFAHVSHQGQARSSDLHYAPYDVNDRRMSHQEIHEWPQDTGTAYWQRNRDMKEENCLITLIKANVNDWDTLWTFGLDLIDHRDVQYYMNQYKDIRLTAIKILEQFFGEVAVEKRDEKLILALRAAKLNNTVEMLIYGKLLREQQLSTDFDTNYRSVNNQATAAQQMNLSPQPGTSTSGQGLHDNVVPFGTSSEIQGQPAGSNDSFSMGNDTEMPDDTAYNAAANVNLRTVTEQGSHVEQITLGSEPEASTSSQLQDPVPPSGTIGDVQEQPAGGNGSHLSDSDIPDDTDGNRDDQPTLSSERGATASVMGSTDEEMSVPSPYGSMISKGSDQLLSEIFSLDQQGDSTSGNSPQILNKIWIEDIARGLEDNCNTA